jgi:hypothetical protein
MTSVVPVVTENQRADLFEKHSQSSQPAGRKPTLVHYLFVAVRDVRA